MYKPDAPVFLNLLKIRMPMTAIVSILHRLSGLVLFLVLPLFIYTLQESLRSPESFAALIEQFDSILLKLIITGLIWSLSHHLLAGLRFLLLDMDIGIQKLHARYTALLVNVTAFIITLISVAAWSCL